LERLAVDGALCVNLGSHARRQAVQVFALDKIISRLIDLYSSLTTQRSK
jgi:hypothetical protein